jgi:hypothetical protein
MRLRKWVHTLKAIDVEPVMQILAYGDEKEMYYKEMDLIHRYDKRYGLLNREHATSNTQPEDLLNQEHATGTRTRWDR